MKEQINARIELIRRLKDRQIINLRIAKRMSGPELVKKIEDVIAAYERDLNTLDSMLTLESKLIGGDLNETD